MKILQILSTLGTGGAEHFTVGLANELVRKGYLCDVVTLFDVESNNDLLRQLDKRIKYASLGKKLGLDVSCYFKLYKFIKQGGYDVVHAHVRAIPYILLSCLLLRKVKFVATIHSEAKREAGRSFSKWTRFYMFKHNKCTPVTISDASKKSFDEYYHMDASMVYNGVSSYTGKGLNNLRDTKDQYLFIHPASCQPVKNQKLLFDAFSRLSNEGISYKLIWLGSKNSYSDIFDELMYSKCSEIEYRGVVSNVRDYFVQADAICLSSNMEGMPMTIIEAFSVGCPSLCTPVGGIVNMIEDGVNGLLSEDLSVESYYRMLKRFVYMSKEDRGSMSQKAKESFSKYSIEKCADNYLKIYNS